MKPKITFITGNQHKAEYLQKLLGFEITYQKIELDEIQSMNLDEIVIHKVKQAYEILRKPVLVEDVSLEFGALNSLPGPFIKFFVEQTGLEATCHILDGFLDRSAVAKCTFGYFDGTTLQLFHGSLAGQIATEPRGDGGYGWDQIFVPNGYGGKTRAELSQEENEESYKIIKPMEQVGKFLQMIHKNN